MVRVKDFKYLQFEKDQKEMADKFGFSVSTDCTPVGMYGRRVNLDMNDPTNLEKTAEDIQDFYGLSPSPTQPSGNGGLADPSKEVAVDEDS